MKIVSRVSEKKKAGDKINKFLEAKIVTGRYYMANTLPKTKFLATKIRAGDKILMSLEPDQF